MAEVMLAVTALVGAGLFLKSLQHAQQLDPGFESRHLLVLSANLDSRLRMPLAPGHPRNPNPAGIA